MITLYSFGPAFGLPDASPFVIKAELLLKMAGLDYQKVPADCRKAPKKKLPYINDKGKTITDSAFIRSYLEESYGCDFDSGLTNRERAIAWSLEKMIEEHLYWSLVSMRWMDDRNYERGPRALLRGAVPSIVQPVVVPMIRRGIAQQLYGQGFGRHTPDEITELGIKSVESLAVVLGENTYLMGANSTGVDAIGYGMISGLLCRNFESPLRAAAEAHANLVSYNEMMARRFYPDA